MAAWSQHLIIKCGKYGHVSELGVSLFIQCDSLEDMKTLTINMCVSVQTSIELKFGCAIKSCGEAFTDLLMDYGNESIFANILV